ncbi:PhnA-like protein [Methylobacterium terricola]|uniref:PhnA-like protein n=1 Tax=Methylobacterium terricola TaxID=2583531 RepID=A0A5C4L4I8_9HYPH|nr:PhnA-like protein [Methylobacterium terricola]TNC05291.1 PhnA-like protein [Methylobacterium terricola]
MPTISDPARGSRDSTLHERDLPQTSPITPAEDLRTVALNQISWGAVFAGAAAALVLQVILNMLGLGIGLSTVDPTGDGTPAASSLGLGAGLWWVISGILASAAGGYLAGRLSGKPSNSTAGYHGLISWAVATLVIFYMLSSAVSGLVGGAFNTASGAVGGLGRAAGGSIQTVAQTAAPSLSKISDPFASIESQVRSGANGQDPAALKDAAVSAMRAAVTGDDAQQAQATEKAAQALARAQNIPVDQARTQVQQYIQQFKDTTAKAKEQAKQAADATARTASQAALYGALALILGALAAFFAGRGAAVDPTITRTAGVPVGQRRA